MSELGTLADTRAPRQGVLSVLAADTESVPTPANSGPLRVIRQWRDWPDGCMALIGPTASGKTKLATEWSTRTGASLIKGSALVGMSIADIHARIGGALAIDDAHQAGDMLLAALNLSRETPLLLTGRARPSAWPMLTRDLQSRLDAIPVTEIGPPCDETMHRLLIATCRDRLIRLPTTVSRYLVRHMSHSYEMIAPMADAIASAGAPPNLATARAILRRMAAEKAHVGPTGV